MHRPLRSCRSDPVRCAGFAPLQSKHRPAPVSEMALTFDKPAPTLRAADRRAAHHAAAIGTPCVAQEEPSPAGFTCRDESTAISRPDRSCSNTYPESGGMRHETWTNGICDPGSSRCRWNCDRNVERIRAGEAARRRRIERNAGLPGGSVLAEAAARQLGDRRDRGHVRRLERPCLRRDPRVPERRPRVARGQRRCRSANRSICSVEGVAAP